MNGRFAKIGLLMTVLFLPGMSSCHQKGNAPHEERAYLTENTDSMKTPKGSTLYITFLGHASIILTYREQVIYVDPVSTYINNEALPKADQILITHEHFDHFDTKAIERLKKES